jgi:3-oxoacyl-[acyl-carrier protein] reductase
MDLGLQGKGVMVTGASGNIGRATAVAFGAEGARVAVGYHRRRVEAQQTAKGVEEGGGSATLVALDLADPEGVARAVDAFERDFGGIDVLVNNAVAWPERGAPGELFESVPLERLRASIAANLVGPYALTQAAVASMRARGWGRIVHLSTGLVEDGFPGSSPYTTPKAALHGLTRTMSRELAPAGIFTNLVMGGYIPHGEVPPAVLEQASLSAATGRPTEAWEVANLIVFLCSTANGHITGEAIRADGHFLTRT